MRLPIFVSTAILIITIIVTSCASTQKEWVRARSADSIATYEAFLDKESSGIYADSARVRRDELIGIEFQAARQQNTVEAYREFLARFPNAAVSKEARSLLTSLINKLREEQNNIREEQLASYKVGVTSESLFRNDNWNLEDPDNSLIGLVGFRHTNGRNEYDLGRSWDRENKDANWKDLIKASLRGGSYFFAVHNNESGFTINQRSGIQPSSLKDRVSQLAGEEYSIIFLTNGSIKSIAQDLTINCIYEICDGQTVSSIPSFIDSLIKMSTNRNINAIWEHWPPAIVDCTLVFNDQQVLIQGCSSA